MRQKWHPPGAGLACPGQSTFPSLVARRVQHGEQITLILGMWFFDAVFEGEIENDCIWHWVTCQSQRIPLKVFFCVCVSWWHLFQLEGFLKGEPGFGGRLERVVAWKLKVASYVESLVSWVASEAETWGQMILNYFIHFVSLFWVGWVPFCAGYSRKCLHFEYTDRSNRVIDYSLCCTFFGNKSKVQAFWNFSGIHNRNNPSCIVTWQRIFFPHFKTYFFKGLDFFFSGFDWHPPTHTSN